MSILTEAEKIAKYDAERAGTIYTLAPATQTASLSDQFAAVMRNTSLSSEEIGRRYAEIAVAAQPKRRERNPYEPFGQLSDGTLIDGHTDDMEPTGRAGVVSADVGDFCITAQDRPNLIGIQGDAFCIDEGPIERLHALRDFLNTPFLDELLASAVAYGRGDTEPPVFAPAKPTSAHSFVNDYLTAAFRRFSRDKAMPTADGIALMTQVIVDACSDELPPTPPAAPASVVVSRTNAGRDYTVGDTILCVEHDKAHCLTVHGHTITINHDYLSEFSDLYTLLADPTVQRYLRIAPAAPAVHVEPHICDDEKDARFGQVIWFDYIAGDDDAKVELTITCDGRWQPLVYAFKREEVDAVVFERAMHNALALFADPRVQAARAGVPLKQAA